MHKLPHKIHKNIGCALKQVYIQHVFSADRPVIQLTAAIANSTYTFLLSSGKSGVRIGHARRAWHSSLGGVWGNRLCVIFVYVDIELDKVFSEEFFDHLVFIAVFDDLFSGEPPVVHERLLILVHTVLVNATSALHLQILGQYLPLLFILGKLLLLRYLEGEVLHKIESADRSEHLWKQGQKPIFSALAKDFSIRWINDGCYHVSGFHVRELTLLNLYFFVKPILKLIFQPKANFQSCFSIRLMK